MLTFAPFSLELAPYFDSINREWINDMFKLEAIDERVISNPQREIIEKGGHIWFALHPELGVVGTCALMKKDEGTFELTKMGVVSTARGLKVGEALLQHVVKEAEDIATKLLFLLTNSSCEAAIHLYEKNGFTHCTEIMKTYGKAYERCNVAMRYAADWNIPHAL
ncbi:GNAT family N-acetyltransferase [Alteromonas sp. S167]|uniref:GNAT family N-acetyltransferase n=1 Tax=Alteromonas sp. S167 TaxID=3117402 RepID=UPI002FE20FF2